MFELNVLSTQAGNNGDTWSHGDITLITRCFLESTDQRLSASALDHFICVSFNLINNQVLRYNSKDLGRGEKERLPSSLRTPFAQSTITNKNPQRVLTWETQKGTVIICNLNLMAAHSSILPWEIPWTEEPEGLQFVGSKSQTRLSVHTSLNILSL